ncbi:uncharacterized protein LOC117642980 [Thrips palmi]|uniref:Uncharacterized protein LOC117642980 n=1 Tax=Thrips palmi TaxID=161013 RepID=A0A6P8YCW0_THRPL|nr:uncharacterized protein LOC117642980 [Thrips palmi]
MAPSLEEDMGAPREYPVRDGLGDEVLLVPLQAPPLAVRDVEEEEEDHEDDGGAAAFLARLLGTQFAEDPVEGPGAMRFFSSLDPLTGDGDDVVLLRLGRSLKSALEPDQMEPRETRVLEDDVDALGADDDDEQEDEDLGLRREHLRSRRAVRVAVHQEPGAIQVADDGPQGRADATTATPESESGSFLETMQNQLPGQLQGIGEAIASAFDPDYTDEGDGDGGDDDGGLGLRDERQHLRNRRALRIVVRQAPGATQVADDGVQVADDSVQGRADATTAAPGSFLETVQNQLPGQLQGLGGAMEDSRMIVGTFQAVIMPGSAATDMGQQIQGFISNMPQIPQLPGGGG